MIEQGLYYTPWKHFTTVVLRKPGKPKYNVAKVYRPIALLNTMIKVLTAILAKQLMYYAEEHNLLPANHFRGRKGRTATDAVHLLVYNIKGAWCKGKVMAVLFLDIEGAFPNADNGQLTRNLLKRRVPVKLVEFVANMLKDRSTTIKFDDHVSGDTLTRRYMCGKRHNQNLRVREAISQPVCRCHCTHAHYRTRFRPNNVDRH